MALLNELKLDRDAPAAERGRPLKWFIAIALAGGIGFALWAFDLPTAGQPVIVKTAIAQGTSVRASNDAVLDATGYVVARRQATVSSKTTGKVVEVLIEEGDEVEAEQLLARLDDSIPRAQYELGASQLESAEASLKELEINLQQAQLDLERTMGLAQRNLASQADLDRDQLSVEGLQARLERARRDVDVAGRSLAVQRQILDDMLIRAPFAGVVIAKAAQPGEMISPVSAGGGFTRTGICTIVDMDSLEIEVDVNESYINRVYPDQPVSVALNAYPDDAYPAYVIAIIPAADRNKATVRVRVGLIERDSRVLPDMGVRVAFLQEQQAGTEDKPEPGVLVPGSSVAEDAEGAYVYVVRDDAVMRRTVRVGGAEGSRVRLLTGIRHGEAVVTQLSGDLLAALSDGRRVTVN